MKCDKYIGFDLHQATTVVAVLDADGKVAMETIVATEAAAIIRFLKSVSGTLSALSNSPYNSGVAPVFVAISPTNKFLYVSNSGNASISAYKIDPTSGDLIPASAAVATGVGPAGIAFGR